MRIFCLVLDLSWCEVGGISSPVLFALYMDPLISQLRHLGLGCTVFGEFYGCLLYADDILLMAHSMYAMQTMEQSPTTHSRNNGHNAIQKTS